MAETTARERWIRFGVWGAVAALLVVAFFLRNQWWPTVEQVVAEWSNTSKAEAGEEEDGEPAHRDDPNVLTLSKTARDSIPTGPVRYARLTKGIIGVRCFESLGLAQRTTHDLRRAPRTLRIIRETGADFCAIF